MTERQFNIPKVKPRPGKADKSGLTFGIEERVRDPAYLKSAKGRACDGGAAHDRETVVAAHVSVGQAAGLSTKADDRLVLWLCSTCHSQLDGASKGPDGAEQGALWIVINIMRPWLKRRYASWRAEKAR